MDDAGGVPVQELSCIPRATLRLQLHAGYGFDDARRDLPYFERLGLSHLFVSPILTARSGSTHGYDIVDHGSVNAELGGEAALLRLVEALRACGMGLIVDIVPNHMAVGENDNPRWLDVLEWGADSRNAGFFDIDWETPDPALQGRVLAPFLGEPYAEALRGAALRLQLEHGRFVFAYHGHRFPLAPWHYPALLAAGGLTAWQQDFAAALRARSRDRRHAGFERVVTAFADASSTAGVDERVRALLAAHDARHDSGFARMHALLDRQNFRLCHWRAAVDEINWRRFFDINTLAALRIEDKAVFDVVHATILRLYAAGVIDGVRIDHVDGLADPRAYCRRLRARLRALSVRRPPGVPRDDALIVVEKILAPQERLETDWQVDGSSGYSFMSEVSALFHDSRGEPELTQMWLRCSGADFNDEERRARRRIAQDLFAADLQACALALHRLARESAETRDWTLAAVRRVLIEILVQFPVYRTYADLRGRRPADAEIMRKVIAAAAAHCRPSELALLQQVDRWLGAEAPRTLPKRSQRAARLRCIARFQQLTSPVAAKAVEDTAFYRHGRLISRNEVGADPAQFSISPRQFHKLGVDRLRRYPHTFLATATHDHKRGEDVRMRLTMLSEDADAWRRVVAEWQQMNLPLRTHGNEKAPDDIDEYIFYQMLVGSWPMQLGVDDHAGLEMLCARLVEWQLKAVREAKRHSGWIEPNAAYEQACVAFVRQVLDSRASSNFLRSVHRYVMRIAPFGAIKSLGQLALRLSCPGIPDLYQGNEYWDLSMVDPDNRRPVDWAVRATTLAETVPTAQLLADWSRGAIKQRLLARLLGWRRLYPKLFDEGRYRLLPVRGRQAHRVYAFARLHRGDALVVVIPRLLREVPLQGGTLGLRRDYWQGTEVLPPLSMRAARWHDVLENRPIQPQDGPLDLGDQFETWPLAVLFAQH